MSYANIDNLLLFSSFVQKSLSFTIVLFYLSMLVQQQLLSELCHEFHFKWTNMEFYSIFIIVIITISVIVIIIIIIIS